MTAPVNQVFLSGSTTPVSADSLNTFVQTVASVAAMRNFTGTVGMVCWLQGLTGASAGGAAMYYWNATSTAADNGTTVIAPTGSSVGRWLVQLASETINAPLTIVGGTVTAATAGSAGYLIEEDITYNLPNTASGIYFGNEFNAVVSGNPPGGAQVWNNLDRVFAETASTSTAPIVNRYMQTTRPLTFDTPGQTIWGAIVDVVDQTGHNSATAGGIIGIELDIQCNDLDNSSSVKRQGLVIVLFHGNGTGSGGVSPQATSAIGIFGGGDPAANFKSTIDIAVPFFSAAIDLRNAGTVPGGTTHGIWLWDGIDIAFDTNGLFTLSSDGTYLNSSKMVNSPHGFAIGSSAQLVSADGSTIDPSEPLRFPGYTVATLPAIGSPEQGAVAFANNARNVGEGSGSGTGCLVCMGTDGFWKAVWSGVAPTT